MAADEAALQQLVPGDLPISSFGWALRYLNYLWASGPNQRKKKVKTTSIKKRCALCGPISVYLTF